MNLKSIRANASAEAHYDFEPQVRSESYTWEFSIQATTLAGTSEYDPVGEVTLSDDKFDGNTITFVEIAASQGIPPTFNYSGEVTDNGEASRRRPRT